MRNRKNLRLKRFVKTFKATDVPYKLRAKNVFFVSQARRLRKNAKLASKFLAEEQQAALLNLGSERRQEL